MQDAPHVRIRVVREDFDLTAEKDNHQASLLLRLVNEMAQLQSCHQLDSDPVHIPPMGRRPSVALCFSTIFYRYEIQFRPDPVSSK